MVIPTEGLMLHSGHGGVRVVITPVGDSPNTQYVPICQS